MGGLTNSVYCLCLGVVVSLAGCKERERSAGSAPSPSVGGPVDGKVGDLADARFDGSWFLPDSACGSMVQFMVARGVVVGWGGDQTDTLKVVGDSAYFGNLGAFHFRFSGDTLDLASGSEPTWKVVRRRCSDTLSRLPEGRVASLCAAGEKDLFPCRAGDKAVSLCASPDFRPDAGRLRLVLGLPGSAPELVWPADPTTWPSRFTFARSQYAKGATAEIAFQSAGQTFTLHEDRHALRGYSAGLAIQRHDSLLVHLECDDSSRARLDLGWVERWKDSGLRVGEPSGVGTPQE